jgi:hypothetical protein
MPRQPHTGAEHLRLNASVSGALRGTEGSNLASSSGESCTNLRLLEKHVASAARFPELALAAATADIGRGGGAPARDPAATFGEMLRRLEDDALWAREYEDFVREVSFAGPGEAIGFADALAACTRLVAVIDRCGEGSGER